MKINIATRNSDNAKFVSLNDLQSYLLESIDNYVKQGGEKNLIKADTLIELSRNLALIP